MNTLYYTICERAPGKRVLLLVGGIVLLLLCLLLPAPTQAQQPTQRQLRTYIPPDQLVSFNASTPFDTFIDFVNPIFERVTGKAVLDPEDREESIGVDVARMHFFDAFELVLDANGFSYRETNDYFIIEQAVPADLVQSVGKGVTKEGDILASLDTREIKINALFFELNLSKTRELGIDWNVFFGNSQGGNGNSGGGSGGGGNQNGSQNKVRFAVKTEDLFDEFSDYLSAPDEIEVSTLTQFFRLLENEGFGETVANPQVTVQSQEQGRIQIGSDVPVQTRDFAGNTITQFFSTGVIVEVVPTLIRQPVRDTVGAPVLDFIHMNVRAENSGSTPSSAGAPIINRSVANTQVLLLDGEQTIIGGLFSSDEQVNRRGVPILKDLPWWFFGLRYVFGYEQKSVVQKELMIVLQAEVVEPLRIRAERPLRDNLLDERRHDIREVIRRFSEKVASETPLPPAGGSPN